MENICDWVNCKKTAKFKAPKERDNSKNFKWLCEEHIKLFNKNWNYFDGMNQNEIESFLKADITWHRPTQKFSSLDNHFNILWNNALNDKFDFCYIDSEHTEEAVYNDLCNWYPKLNENGFMCGDDWILKVIKWPSKEWDECINTESHEYDLDQRDFKNTLRRGVKRFAKENNLNIFSIQNFWWLAK